MEYKKNITFLTMIFQVLQNTYINFQTVISIGRIGKRKENLKENKEQKYSLEVWIQLQTTRIQNRNLPRESNFSMIV